MYNNDKLEMQNNVGDKKEQYYVAGLLKRIQFNAALEESLLE